MKKVCMIVQDKLVKGGIAAVISGYYESSLKNDYQMIYVESYKDGNKACKLLKGISGYFRFFKVLVVDKPDLIHIHSSFGPSFYRKLPFIIMAYIAKKPIINHIHGADFDSFYLNASNHKKNLIRRTYNKCTMLIALSQEWKSKLSLIVPEEEIAIIENYSTLHEEVIEERRKRGNNKQVLFLGEIGKRKGCYDIPNVMKIVCDTIPETQFVIAGDGSAEDKSAIMQLIVEEHLEKNVQFPGWVRESAKDSLLRQADVFFLPSYNEGMPMSILDAMGYGLPVISTTVGGIPKIVREGQNGMCFIPGDVNNMAEGIIQLLSNPEFAISQGLGSIAIVREGYSLEQHIKKVSQLYEDILTNFK